MQRSQLTRTATMGSTSTKLTIAPLSVYTALAAQIMWLVYRQIVMGILIHIKPSFGTQVLASIRQSLIAGGIPHRYIHLLRVAYTSRDLLGQVQ